MGNKINRTACACGILLLVIVACSLTRVDAQNQASEVQPSSRSLPLPSIPPPPPSPDDLEELPQELPAEEESSPAPPPPPRSSLSSAQNCGDSCLRCEFMGCVKCRGVILHGSRRCLVTCPESTHYEEWSTLVDYMGRLCIERPSSEVGWLSSVTSGLGSRELAVLVGAAAGAGICALLLLVACGWIACNRSKARRRTSQGPGSSRGATTVLNVYDDAMVGPRGRNNVTEQWLTPQECATRREFAKQVASLRPDAPVFLAMLNDTRRKVRELYRPNGTDSRSKAYRTVLRDLSHLLTLLNRPEERLGPPPPDWPKLMAWAERSLRRFKKSCGGSSSGSIGGGGSACSSGAASSASSTPSSSHALNQHHLPPEVHQTHSILQLPLPPECGVLPLHHHTIEDIEVPALLQSSSEWGHASLVNGLYYDSYYPLGLRPQDEITTEL